MQTRIRWHTVLSIGMLLAVLASAAGYFYWASRPFTLEQLAPVDKPTLVHTIKLPEAGSEFAWNSRGDRLAVAHLDLNKEDQSVVSIYTVDGKRLRQLAVNIDAFNTIDDLEWHPTKDILAVSYRQALVLWSADGTIIKRINNGIESAFQQLSWNQQTNELAVIDYYAYNGEYYNQIVLFDEYGTKIRRFPTKFGYTTQMKWINQVNIIVNVTNRIYTFNTITEEWIRLFEDEQYAVDIDSNHNRIVGAGENNDKELEIWQNGIIKTIELAEFSGRIPKSSPRGDYTVLYTIGRLNFFNHHTQEFEIHPLTNKDLIYVTVEWHPSKPILATLLFYEIQVWQFPE
ncbi:MAG TPA: hypothetical protein DEF47_07835 [Herpetosiphon sp.]|uniref:Anaphase-promoting complex subunit 4 WD40 domain-containing protein n=1 Tax=Herpetosiphon aurantiacus (strain ATCC 23779 / DSM 785 / 114-95) TaxID=316274 RepID=A9B785_HERA2|nr:hypothetical protein [Herpetosiphon sp.]ABX06368.1 hypothetical protein Haur_3732 [Herpetosiphon aurantiacus DSM 785]HBW49801.1 hypothetical protein [Herpetosiphon sp.]